VHVVNISLWLHATFALISIILQSRNLINFSSISVSNLTYWQNEFLIVALHIKTEGEHGLCGDLMAIYVYVSVI
jgi:hypothetical protein